MPSATATHLPSNTILAISSSTDYKTVEGNIYFPPSSLLVDALKTNAPVTHLQESKTHTTCPWKGKASYYDLILDDGSKLKDIGWFYPNAKNGAKEKGIEGFLAWDRRVEVEVES